LGAIDLRDRRGHPIREILAQPKRVALLVYLAVEGRRAGGIVPRDRLLALFWPESDSAHARNTLSQALHHLRQALGADVIESQGANTVGIHGDQLWCDATTFLEAIERGDVELALDLYRGEFCPTLFTSGAPELEHWLDAVRRQIRTHAFAAAKTYAERLAARGDREAAARAARNALALQPDDEADVRALLALLERLGDVTGALLVYQEYAKRLTTELETEPAAETKGLIEGMRRRREQAATAVEAVEAVAPRTSVAPVAGPPAARRVATRSRRSLLGALAVAVAVSGAIIGTVRSQPQASPAVRSIAVFPFIVRGGAHLAYLREGMVDLLSAKLDGAGGFRAVDPRSVIALANSGTGAPPDAAAIARAARSLGAAWYVTGDAVQMAGRLQINGALHDLSGGTQALATASVSGDTTALFELVDDLTGRMLAGLSRGRDTALTRLASVTTHSLPALKAFLDGERALRAGRDAQAAAAFSDAALLDTTFALAQYRLAVTSTWINVRDAPSPKVWAAMAARHAQRLTPLVRDLLTAYRAYQELHGDEAERMYRGLSGAHPQNVEAWMMLGETLFHLNWLRGRSPMEAWPVFQRVLALDSTNAHAAIHLARLAALEGRADELDALAQRYVAMHRDAERALEMQTLQAYVRDDPAMRAEVANAVQEADEFVQFSVLQAALVYAQNLDHARELAAPFTAAGRSTITSIRIGRRLLSDVAVGTGRWGRAAAARILGSVVDQDWVTESAALVAADPFFPIGRPEVAALRDTIAARRAYPMMTVVSRNPDVDLGGAMQAYLMGLLSARLGDTVAAHRYTAELIAMRDERTAGVARELAHGVRAELARVRGDPQQALVELQSFRLDPSGPGLIGLAHWGLHERFLHGELLVALGRDAEALPWYNAFSSPYDLPYLGAAHLRQGEIYERLGNKERAQFHYGRAVTLWHDCDAQFQPLLARAREGLQRVSSDRAVPSPAVRVSTLP
jgi:DNA-binding SARP family transcriptional activator/TolB-like protein